MKLPFASAMLIFAGVFASACTQPGGPSDCASGGSLQVENQTNETVHLTFSATGVTPITADLAAGASQSQDVPTGSFSVTAVGAETSQTLLMGSYTVSCGASTPVVIQPEPQVTLGVSLTGTGHGTVTAQGLSCTGSTCNGTYDQDLPVTLVAASNSDSSFSGWGGACTSFGTQTQCTVTLSQATNVTAQFDLLSFSTFFTVTGTGQGTVTSDPSGIDCGNGNNGCATDFTAGTPVTFTATAATGSHVSAWTGPCAGAGTNTSCQVTVSGGITSSVQFDLDPEQLTVAPTGPGSVTSNTGGINCGNGAAGPCDATYPYGSMVTLTAVPATGYQVTWGGACAASGSSSTCTVTLDGATTVTASYSLISEKLSLTVDSQCNYGTITANVDPNIDCQRDSSAHCTGYYPYGTKITLTATNIEGVNAGLGWESGPCKGALTTNTTCTFTITGPVSAEVCFGGGIPR